MNKLYFLIISFILYNCSENQINGPNNNELISSIQIQVSDQFYNKPFYIKDAELSINNNSFITNDSGIVFIESIEKGSYNLLVFHPFYEPLDSNLVINDSTKNFEIVLNPLFYDFFPLDETNYFVYSYELNRMSYSIFSGPNSYNAVGTLKINILTKEINENKIMYLCSAEYDLIVHDVQSSILLDTTYQKNWIQEFMIYQDEKFKISSDSNVPEYWSNIFINGDFRRYHPQSRGNLINYINNVQYLNEEFIIKADSGFTKIDYEVYGPARVNENYKLKLLNIGKK